jgi:hypothetical protein
VIINQRVMGWRNYLSFENPAQVRRLVGAYPHQAFALIRGL